MWMIREANDIITKHPVVVSIVAIIFTLRWCSLVADGAVFFGNPIYWDWTPW